MSVDDIDRIAVLGAGVMGHGIAAAAALAGFEVALRDTDETLVREGYRNAGDRLDDLVDRGDCSRAAADGALDRIDPVVDLSAAVAGAGAVVEAVPEDPELKRSVFRAADEHAPEGALLATNTSSLRVTGLAAATGRPGRVCGLHFFNPPLAMELVEVVRGERTAPETLAVAEELAAAMGKTPVRVHEDRPGFIVNRVLLPYLNEAAWAVEAGDAAVPAVEATAKEGLGLPTGPFELADRIGAGLVVDSLERFRERFGDAYEPCPTLERRSGDGSPVDTGSREEGTGGVDPADDGEETALERRFAAVLANQFAAVVQEGIADVAAVDEALRLGAGFPAGPGAMADGVGAGTLFDTLRERHEATDHPRYEPAPLLAAYARGDRQFGDDREPDPPEFETIRTMRNAGVGRIVVDRPDRMNTITPTTLEELEAARERFEADGAVTAVLVTGAGERAFSAGADLEAIDRADAGRGAELARAGQRVFGGFEAGDLPVVAGIDGYCLGGGMELAAACDLRVAGDSATFGQPERDLGLLPGWGGTQRLPRIVGEGRAKELVLTGERFGAQRMADDGFLTRLCDDEAVAGTAFGLAADLAAGPPLAQGRAKRAIHAGRSDPAAGLAVEAESFGLLADTGDAAEGIAAFRESRDPEFEGR